MGLFQTGSFMDQLFNPIKADEFKANTTPSTSQSVGQVMGASNYLQPAGAPYYSDQQALANSKAGLNYGTGNPAPTNTGGGGSPAPTPAPSGFNKMDRNQNPGEGWFYDAADGWKQTGGGGGMDLLSQGYDEYYKSLDQQLASLGGSRTEQEAMAQRAYDQGLGTVQNQYQTSQQQLDTNRQKTLRDLSNNLQQSWQQGNTFLGTRGASDSSAANQYSYALAKLGNQQRGDVQSQYDQNVMNLKTAYDTETKNLEYSLQNQLSQISQWYADAQRGLQGARGEAARQKSQEALNYAMQLAQQAQQEAASRRSVLDQWAANNAKSFQELAGQLQQGANFSVQAPSSFGMTANGGGYGGVQTGYGSSTEKDIFGNILR